MNSAQDESSVRCEMQGRNSFCAALKTRHKIKGRLKIMLWTLISFVGFTILVAVISYFKTKGDNQSTSEGYFLAGRGLPGFVIAGSLLLTNLSAEQLVGSNGQTWLVGMSPMAFEVLAAPCCIALALFAAPRYLKSGITTSRSSSACALIEAPNCGSVFCTSCWRWSFRSRSCCTPVRWYLKTFSTCPAFSPLGIGA